VKPFKPYGLRFRGFELLRMYKNPTVCEGKVRLADRYVQRKYSLGSESSISTFATFVRMERPCRRIDPHTGTLAGLSRAQSSPSLLIGHCVHTLYFRGATRKRISLMDILLVSFEWTHEYLVKNYIIRK
jgi:hypothetical protein